MSRKFKRVISILLAAALLIPSIWLAPVAKAAGSIEQPDTVTIYHESFADGKGAATQSGGASLTPVIDKAFAGNADRAALYVSNRTNTWDAIDFKFADIGLENGKTYTVTTSVYVDADVTVPSGAQAYLQTVESYGFLAGADFVAGSAFTMTKEFTVDMDKDSALRVQSSEDGKTVPFYIGDVLITEKVASSGGEPQRDPALPFNTITFENQTKGDLVGRAGTETLTVTKEANHTEGGSYALKVEGRTNTWHGPTLRVEKYVDKGFEYTISVWVKLIDPASSQLQLSTQVGNTSPSYNTILSKTITNNDGWVLYEGKYRYTSVGDEYLTIYVESSSNSTASFYIDDVSFVKGSEPISVQKDLTPIKTAYENNFLIGNAVSMADLEGSRLELLKLHHNVVTTENAMKPDYTYNDEKEFDFTAENALVDKVLAEGLKLHGHVLVWHQQMPTWLSTSEDGSPLNRDVALANLKTHIETVMKNYGDKVISWDIVNEAMSDNPPNPSDWKASLRQSPWKAAIGDDYIEQAYLIAREVLDENGWDIKLYYNDYNEDNQNKAMAIYNMIKEINDRYALTHDGKLLIDGMGMQAHYNINTKPENVKNSLDKFISLGVEVSITELDITAGSDSVISEKEANAQGYLYAQLMNIYKDHASNIARVTFWGLNDATSWRAAQSPLLFDKDLQAKPAYYGVIDPDKFIEEHPPASTIANQAIAKYATPVIDGTVDSVWSKTNEIPINRYQMAWQGSSGVAKALWDDQNLYVLIQVSDAQLDKSSANAYEQDSIEIFLDQNNAKSFSYQDDDGQYRVNFDNETSFNPEDIATDFVSATKVSGTNYTVEVKIPLKSITPTNNTKLGFDVQINDAKDGGRQSVAAWNDTTGQGFQDTSVYGELTLTNALAAPSSLTATALNHHVIKLDWDNVNNESSTTYSVYRSTTVKGQYDIVAENLSNSEYVDNKLAAATTYYYKVVAVTPSNISEPATTHTTTKALPQINNPDPNSNSNPNSEGKVVQTPDESVKIETTVKTVNGRVEVTISNNNLKKALERIASVANGKKQVVVDVAKQADAKSYEVRLSTQSLKGEENFVIVMKTEHATVEIPSNILSNMTENAEQVSIRVAKVTTDNLDATTRELIGNRPVLDLSVVVDDKVIAWNNPHAPVTISVPYKPTAEELSNPDSIIVWYIADNGDVTSIPNGRYDATTGMVIFQTTHFSTYAVTSVVKTFDDLKNVPWAKQAIDALAARDIIKGTSADSFSPEASIKRADAIALLVRALELQGTENNDAMFSDVEKTAYYYDELVIAKELGIATGLGDNKFKPNSNISLQDMMVLTTRALEVAGKQVEVSGALDAIPDAPSISNYANGKIAPNKDLTRAEAAVILYRIWNL
ncbi:endo-1,4-beta-xylanase [Paenibacillus crassostreae]|uniref:Beta-xylanase n=1 Tax=Paenibacillus crassostreae TaxID=1763538 RepID=A0A167GDD1_9BACL|nr:endo-1,4-beta-xylanase [Paenibacillus crassostreae]OAB77467.1 1,4-beta-xylanase [Paenibacillus crassostreae]